MTSLRPFLLLSLASIALSGCSFTPFLYKPDITQGNVYNSEQISIIRAGMNREQVHQLLGTPSIIDPFHPEIDIYAFSFTSGKENRKYQRRFTVHYVNNIVSNVSETPLSIHPK